MVLSCSLKQQSPAFQRVPLNANAGSYVRTLPGAQGFASQTTHYESDGRSIIRLNAKTRSKPAKPASTSQNHHKHCARERELARTTRLPTGSKSVAFLEPSSITVVPNGILKRKCQRVSRTASGNTIRRPEVLLDRYRDRTAGSRGAVCCMKEDTNAQQKKEPKLSLVARFFSFFSRKQETVAPLQESCTTTEIPDGACEIQLQDVSRVYGKRTVVDGVNLSVKQGEVVGLLGPNGAGKSTTFNITVGRERPSQGCVMLNGSDVTALPLAARARLGVGYLTQEPSVFRGLSVRDNLLLILQETGVPRAEQAGRIAELLAEFRLTHVQHTKGGGLSGGERRRTELARALASNCSGGPPKILLVDEPFAGVDPIGVAEIQALLRKLCDELNMGILITDHNVTETLKICDRAYMVFQGQVMAQGSPQELVQNPFVRQYYLGEGYRRPQ